MAGLYAIAAVSETIRGILYDARPQPEFSGAQIEVFQVPDLQKTKPLEEGVSILLYRVEVSAQQRSLTYKIDAQGNNVMPALPIDLHFLLSVWGKTAVKQQRLLGWMVRLLADMSTIGAGVLNYYGRPDKTFEDSENVTLIHDPLTLSDMSNLWDVLKSNSQLSIAYLARMVYIDSTAQVEGGEIVQTRVFDMAHYKPQGRP